MTSSASCESNRERQLLELQALDAIYGTAILRDVHGAVRDADSGEYTFIFPAEQTEASSSREAWEVDEDDELPQIEFTLCVAPLLLQENIGVGEVEGLSLRLALPAGYPEGQESPLVLAVSGPGEEAGDLLLRFRKTDFRKSDRAGFDEKKEDGLLVTTRARAQRLLDSLPGAGEVELLQEFVEQYAALLKKKTTGASSPSTEGENKVELQHDAGRRNTRDQESCSVPAAPSSRTPPTPEELSAVLRHWLTPEEKGGDGVFEKALLSEGFQKYGGGDEVDSSVFANLAKGVTIERCGIISCDGLEEDDVREWLACQLAAVPMDAETKMKSNLVRALLQWVRAAAAEDGFAPDDEVEQDLDGDDDGTNSNSPSTTICTAYLQRDAQAYRPDREIAIYTWGRAILKAAPVEAEKNFNATVLSGRGAGINLRKMNGLDVEIQARVSRCSLFPQWMKMVVGKIEAENLKAIAVNCRKGRHRSVAAAELLKKLYYKNAKVTHLTIV